MECCSVDSQIPIMHQIELVEHVTQEKYRAIQEEEFLLGAHCTPVHAVSHLGCEGAACWSPIDAGSAPVHPHNYLRIAPEGDLQPPGLVDPVINELLTETEPTPHVEAVVQVPVYGGSCLNILRRKIKWDNSVIVVRHCLSSEVLH